MPRKIALWGLGIIAVICGGFGIYSLIELAESITMATILWIFGVVVFIGISVGAITLAWFGWTGPMALKYDSNKQ